MRENLTPTQSITIILYKIIITLVIQLEKSMKRDPHIRETYTREELELELKEIANDTNLSEMEIHEISRDCMDAYNLFHAPVMKPVKCPKCNHHEMSVGIKWHKCPECICWITNDLMERTPEEWIKKDKLGNDYAVTPEAKVGGSEFKGEL